MTCTRSLTGIVLAISSTMALWGCSHQGDRVPEWVIGPVDHLPVPQHPKLAPNGQSNMHDDAYMTDTYEWSGPLNENPDVILKSYADSTNTCVTVVFDSKGRMVTTSAQALNFSILLIDPDTLAVLASYDLPPRNWDDPLYPYNDTSGATYFVLDTQDRIIFSDPTNSIQVIEYDEGQGAFRQVDVIDLSEHVASVEAPSVDHVQMAIPDWDAPYLWFTTRYGIVGTIHRATHEVHTVDLNGEELENSFAVAEDGAYIISDHAMYRFTVDDQGSITQQWRSEYDRGSRVKPSNFNQGSGTTPQIFGDMVAITDNAEPRMHVLFLRRSDGSVACSLPVFPESRSTTENAPVGLVRQGEKGLEYSVIVDNNYGIEREKIMDEGRCWQNHEGGMVRVDMLPDGQGGFSCRQVWHTDEKSSQVLPKLSLATGLLYIYTYRWMEDAKDYEFFLTTLDFETGSTVFSIPTGQGLDYANFGQPLIISPDGDALLGTMGGLVRVRDR